MRNIRYVSLSLGLIIVSLVLGAPPPTIIDLHPAADLKVIDSIAINDAIQKAPDNAIIRLNDGEYRCLSIRLKNHLTLQLEKNARLIAINETPEARYDPAEPNANDHLQDYGHSHWHNSLVWGENLEDVSIIGSGTIDGKGLARGHKKPDDPADKAIALKNCKNITLRDFTIVHGGHFAVLATGLEQMQMDNLTIDTNRDGIDLDSCKEVKVSRCRINSPLDDGICLKSTVALGRLQPCESIDIVDCQLSGYDEGTLIDQTHQKKDAKVLANGPVGRIKLGTESSGGFKKINVAGCKFDYCRGIAIESVDGNVLEDVSFDQIEMNEIVDSPIFIRLGSRNRGAASPLQDKSVLRNVRVTNLRARSVHSRYPCIISGTADAKVERVLLKNIEIQADGMGHKASPATQPIEAEGIYPEPPMFGLLPSYALYIRHAKEVNLDSFQYNLTGDDERFAVHLEDVDGIVLNNVLKTNPASTPRYSLQNVKRFQINNPEQPDLSRGEVISEKLP